MIELGSSIISSTIATVILYPAERIRIQMQLNTVKQASQKTSQKELTNLLELEQNLDILKEKEQFSMKQQIEYQYQKTSSAQKVSVNQQETLSQEVSITRKSTSIKQTILSIYSKHGWTGFYTGLQSLVIGNGLSYGVYFVLYEKCKHILGFTEGSVIDTIMCSGIAGIGASIATNPFWVLQTKQAQQKGSILQNASNLIKNQGPMSLWKGLSSSLILVSNPIIQFVIYEQLKKFVPVDKNSGIYALVIFIIGAISKMISTLCTYPLTVIRTKQHISVDKKQWSTIVKNIIKAEGMKGLYHGIEPKLIQTVLNSALLLMLFEKIRNIMINYFVTK